jgi:FeS assembly SUF system protein
MIHTQSPWCVWSIASSLTGKGNVMNGKPVELGTARVASATPREEGPVDPMPTSAEQQPAAASTPVNMSSEQLDQLRGKIIDILHTCFDPEIPVNIYELGLIYDLILKPDGAVNILMTLTTPACPVAGSLPGEVERKVKSVPGVTAASVDLVWDPPWDKNRMSEAAKLQLGIDDW